MYLMYLHILHVFLQFFIPINIDQVFFLKDKKREKGHHEIIIWLELIFLSQYSTRIIFKFIYLRFHGSSINPWKMEEYFIWLTDSQTDKQRDGQIDEWTDKAYSPINKNTIDWVGVGANGNCFIQFKFSRKSGWKAKTKSW